MRFWNKRSDLTAATNEIVHSNAAAHASRGGLITAIASGVALIFSAISLYHSVLKQPDLQFYVSPVVHYGRERATNYETFAVPLTIANHGARDGAVLGISLDVVGPDGSAKNFYSAYFVESDFFAPPDRFNQQNRSFDRAHRPKEPYAPLSIAGRGNYTGTILFYAKSEPDTKVVTDRGDYKLRISLETKLDESLGPIDKLLRIETKPITFTASLKRYSDQMLRLGATHRMSNVTWATSVADTESSIKSKSASEE